MIDMKAASKESGRAAVGIDPARASHKVAMLSPASNKEVIVTIPNLPDAVNIFERAIEKHLGHPAVEIAIEGYGGCGERFALDLVDRGYPVYELNPRKSATLRDAFSENSSDELDARVFAQALLHFPSVLTPVKTTREIATFKRLGRLRQHRVDDRTRCLNQLHRALIDTYGIAYKGLFPDLKTKKALQFFSAYPSINRALDNAEAVKGSLGVETGEALAAAGRWQDDAYLEAAELQVQLLVDQIALYNAQIKMVEEKLVGLLENMGEKPLENLRGAGTAIRGTIIGETGDVTRFPNHNAYVAYCGLAPASKQSGSMEPFSKSRNRYNRRLKQAFFQLALVQLRDDGPSRVYFQKKRKEGKSGRVAHIALARWLARIVYRMLTTRTPYRYPRGD
jgi:transposase